MAELEGDLTNHGSSPVKGNYMVAQYDSYGLQLVLIYFLGFQAINRPHL